MNIKTIATVVLSLLAVAAPAPAAEAAEEAESATTVASAAVAQPRGAGTPQVLRIETLMAQVDRMAQGGLMPAGSNFPLEMAPRVQEAIARADRVTSDLRRNQGLLGAVMLAAGLLMAPSRNEWAIDEGWIGASAASIGGILLIDAAMPAGWRR